MKKNKSVVKFAQLGDPVLRRQARVVESVFSTGIRDTIEKMRILLTNSNGVGLAAPQVFNSVRILIIASRPSKRYPLAPEMEPVIIINPSFQALSQNKKKDWEGCLSIPEIRALVPRYEKIEISYSDEQGIEQKLIVGDFVARIFQHEYDHLNGLVFLDRVEDNQDIISESEFQKMMESKLK